MPAQPVICLMRDLLFYSKIRAAAAAVHASIVSVRDPAQLAGRDGALLLFDLNQPDTLVAAAEWAKRCKKPAVAFVSHVDSELIRSAKSAGIETVLPRSQFEKKLPDLFAAAQVAASE